jgi:glycolate oxidase FAD binding subunit
MAVSTRALAEGFRAIVGRTHARDDVTTREAAAVDGVVPSLVVAPASGDETSAVVALAAGERLAIVPRGSGSSVDQGAPAERVDLVLDLSRLDRIVEYNPDDLTISVEAGVTAGALATRLDGHGQMLPIDPPGARARTLGGLTATNASGPLRARYGTLRDLLLGVRFVQADGVLTWGGAKVVKSVSGYDVPKLMVGALGTLGVLTELTLRLHARPEVERTSLVTLGDVVAAQTLVGRILDSSLQPTRLEVFDAATVTALGGTAGGAGIAISFGSVEAAADEQEREVARLARNVGALAVKAAPALWPIYETLWRRRAGWTMLTVGSLPARLEETFAAARAAAAELGREARVLTGGCAVVGSFRVLIANAPAAAVATFIEGVRAGIGAWSGTAMVLGAPHDVRTAVDPWGPVPPDAFALMRSIKETFDPDRRLNPGRFVGGL